MTTGQRIKAARKQAGLTQKELAKKLGIAYQTLAQWENDRRNPKPETLQRIADALDLFMVELVGNESKENGFWYGYYASDQETQHIAKVFNYSFSQVERDLIKAFVVLNDTGQEEAVKRVKELTEILRYRREDIQQSP